MNNCHYSNFTLVLQKLSSYKDVDFHVIFGYHMGLDISLCRSGRRKWRYKMSSIWKGNHWAHTSARTVCVSIEYKWMSWNWGGQSLSRCSLWSVLPIATWQISQHKFTCDSVVFLHHLLNSVFSSIYRTVETNEEEQNTGDGDWWHNLRYHCITRREVEAILPPHQLSCASVCTCARRHTSPV